MIPRGVAAHARGGDEGRGRGGDPAWGGPLSRRAAGEGGGRGAGYSSFGSHGMIYVSVRRINSISAYSMASTMRPTWVLVLGETCFEMGDDHANSLSPHVRGRVVLYSQHGCRWAARS